METFEINGINEKTNLSLPFIRLFHTIQITNFAERTIWECLSEREEKRVTFTYTICES